MLDEEEHLHNGVPRPSIHPPKSPEHTGLGKETGHGIPKEAWKKKKVGGQKIQ